ncbi:12716_t:CDS:2 [Ambispora leptoticha]|uniref:12716_t:CDS:1 n=1 Tax=Ambispora leptoticha TaxID=144679 RepID=A0A9N8VKX4_9GLOM|nr:12716_t:CDS:2 [Ambispora leptoticha]
MVEIPRLPFCCFVVPLRIGAFVIAAFMFFWNAYAGITTMLTTYGSNLSILWKVMGGLYLLVAAGAFYGAHAIYHEIPERVAKFVKIYIASIITYFVVSIAFVIAVSLAVASVQNSAVKACEDAKAQAPTQEQSQINCNTGYTGFPIVGWLFQFLFALAFEIYFAICIRSYSLELQESDEKRPNEMMHA